MGLLHQILTFRTKQTHQAAKNPPFMNTGRDVQNAIILDSDTDTDTNSDQDNKEDRLYALTPDIIDRPRTPGPQPPNNVGGPVLRNWELPPDAQNQAPPGTAVDAPAIDFQPGAIDDNVWDLFPGLQDPSLLAGPDPPDAPPASETYQQPVVLTPEEQIKQCETRTIQKILPLFPGICSEHLITIFKRHRKEWAKFARSDEEKANYDPSDRIIEEILEAGSYPKQKDTAAKKRKRNKEEEVPEQRWENKDHSRDPNYMVEA